MTDEDLARKILRECFAYDISDKVSPEVTIMARRFVYDNLDCRRAMIERITRGIKSVRQNERDRIHDYEPAIEHIKSVRG